MSIEVLFCRPSSSHDESDFFEIEAIALDQLGIEAASIPIEPIVNGDPEQALRHIPEQPGRRWLFRGWMLDEAEYESLDEAIHERGESLVVSPEEFALANYVSNYVPLIEQHTAKTRWTFGTDIDEAWVVAQELGPPPWFIKDHVKSAKEHWHSACLVPEGSTREDFAAVCEALLDVRGDRFERGFVIREKLPLAELPYRMPERPVHDEHRLFVWQGEIVAHAPYQDVETEDPPFHSIDGRRDRETFGYLREVDSPFFTADVARLEDGSWKVIELNDGGVSTLPELMDPRDLYRAIKGADQ